MKTLFKKVVWIQILLTFTQLDGIAQNSAAFHHSWFKVKKINETIWQINDNDIDNIYLIEGKDSALLIDNGMGEINLRDFIKTITKLPVIVVNTHSHPDHAGRNNQFQQVYAHLEDFKMIKFFTTRKFQKDAFKPFTQNPIPESVRYIEKDTLHTATLLPVKEGYMFDLGGRKVEVIHTPGHTPGSICLLDHKDKYLFTGDTNNTLVWMHIPDALPLETYLQSLKKLQGRSNEFITLLPGHGDPTDKEFIGEQIACAENIIAGKCTGEPYKTFVGDGLVCKFKRAQIAYNPAKITAGK